MPDVMRSPVKTTMPLSRSGSKAGERLGVGAGQTLPRRDPSRDLLAFGDGERSLVKQRRIHRIDRLRKTCCVYQRPSPNWCPGKDTRVNCPLSAARITSALDGHADLNSIDSLTSSGTSARSTREKPKRGKKSPAVVVSK
jgi:hypothetical protein